MTTIDRRGAITRLILSAQIGNERTGAQQNSCAVFAAALAAVLADAGIDRQIMEVATRHYGHAVVEADGILYDSLGQFKPPLDAKINVYVGDPRQDYNEDDFPGLWDFFYDRLTAARVAPPALTSKKMLPGPYKSGDLMCIKMGGATLCYADDVWQPGLIHVQSLKTVPSRLGRGHARALMLAAADFWAAAGYHKVDLGAASLDRKTHQARLEVFYQSLGFQPTGRAINTIGNPEMQAGLPLAAPTVLPAISPAPDDLDIVDLRF